MVKWISSAGLALAALASAVLAEEQKAQPIGASAPVELVRSHIDVDVNADGTYVVAKELALRVLDSRGQKMLQQTTLSYTDGLQDLQVISAYTEKADGEKIPVDADKMLRGLGETSAPGFEDLRTITIVFPKLDIGDKTVLETVLKQKVPLFPGQFAVRFDYSRAIKADDVELTLTAAQGQQLNVQATGVEGGDRRTFAGKNRWAWHFENRSPVSFAVDSAVGADDQPHVAASTFASYAAVGHAYGERFDGKSAVTPEIQALANDLTRGLVDRRAIAEALYDWVTGHISYVNIVLGAGGYTPHSAAEVLKNRFGDCKDHVMLLDALLAAKGIESVPALIEAGGAYVLPDVPSAFYFNHLITYVPELHLFLDSTQHFLPFGVLPDSDADRPVVLVPSGDVSGTPRIGAEESTTRVSVKVDFDDKGTAVGDANIANTGNLAFSMRSLIDLVPPDQEKQLFSLYLGPASEVTINRGNISALRDPFTYSFHYRVPDAAAFDGPGAVSTSLALGALSQSGLVLGLLPPSRDTDYQCPSFSIRQTAEFRFPEKVKVTSVPRAVTIDADGYRFADTYDIRTPQIVEATVTLRADHPRGFCSPDYYNRIRGDLMRIAASLRGQILYK